MRLSIFQKIILLLIFALVGASAHSPGNDDDSQSITGYQLMQNYPNPFNPTTRIEYRVSNTARVTLKIYNILGQEIRTLVNELQGQGVYSVEWNGTGNRGTEVAGGIYFYRLEIQEQTSGVTSDNKLPIFVQTRKMTFLK